MKPLSLSFLALLLLCTTALSAQGTPVPATDDSDAMMADKSMAPTQKSGTMLEFGIRPGYMWTAGDVDATAGYGVGAHFRKSLDHVFSLRLDGLYGQSAGQDKEDPNQQFENVWISSNLNVLVTLNNLRPKGDIRKTNFYVLAGAGANWFDVEFNNGNGFDVENRRGTIARDFGTHANAGGGINFRAGRRFNLGVEYQAFIPFGSRADRLDGYTQGNNRDVQNFASLSLNFNLGGASKNEPLYWKNVFSDINQNIDDMGQRVDAATKDSDGDGVVDAIDQEANTPAGAPVDTKGRVLDSDKDGVPDYRDLEPFFPPRAGETVDDNGVVINRNDKPITEDRVQEMIDASIARAQANQNQGSTRVVTDRGEIYLPMIYFPLGQHTIKYGDYGTLSSVARVLQGNPGMKLVIRGYTDRTGNAADNTVLSYRRAKAVVDHLVNQHGIDRSRLVLQYRGQENAIVPRDQSVVNRRVEFQTAEDGAQEDAAPAGASGRGGY